MFQSILISITASLNFLIEAIANARATGKGSVAASLEATVGGIREAFLAVYASARRENVAKLQADLEAARGNPLDAWKVPIFEEAFNRESAIDPGVAAQTAWDQIVGKVYESPRAYDHLLRVAFGDPITQQITIGTKLVNGKRVPIKVTRITKSYAQEAQDKIVASGLSDSVTWDESYSSARDAIRAAAGI